MSGTSEGRRDQTRRRVGEALLELARRACRLGLALTAQPPPPEMPRPFGDLVPLGFVLRALKGLPGPDGGAAGEVARRLLDARQGRLWSYHTGALVTAIDSALVLLGLGDADGIAALESFADGHGGYVPQLWSDDGAPGTMLRTPAYDHWCQPDLVTTCLVRGLRGEAGLPVVTPAAVIAAAFERRGGLFFANPYLTDWAVAFAVAGDPDAHSLRRRLAADLIAGQNPDGSFGRFDPVLSTAAAVLALGCLGCRGVAPSRGRSALAGLLDAGPSAGPSTPFYSTRTVPRERLPGGLVARLMLGDRVGQLAWVGGSVHAVTYYQDTDGLTATAAAALALREEDPRVVSETEPGPAGAGREAPHPRYRCADLAEYVAKFALPPYLAATASDRPDRPDQPSPHQAWWLESARTPGPPGVIG